MSCKTLLLGAAAALSLATAAWAESAIMVVDPYIRTARPGAPTGAAFMGLMNHSTEDDRLVAAASDIAERVELHTHKQDANGVMRMVELEDGIAIAAGATHRLQRGGDHVMFMGLNRDLKQGETINLTLRFEKAGEVTVEIPVDLERKPEAGGMAPGHNHAGGHSGGHSGG